MTVMQDWGVFGFWMFGVDEQVQSPIQGGKATTSFFLNEIHFERLYLCKDPFYFTPLESERNVFRTSYLHGVYQ